MPYLIPSHSDRPHPEYAAVSILTGGLQAFDGTILLANRFYFLHETFASMSAAEQVEMFGPTTRSFPWQPQPAPVPAEEFNHASWVALSIPAKRVPDAKPDPAPVPAPEVWWVRGIILGFHPGFEAYLRRNIPETEYRCRPLPPYHPAEDSGHEIVIHSTERQPVS